MASTEHVNILVVDENGENRIALETILGAPGQNLIQARSGQEALDYLLQRDVAVVLLSVDIAGMTAFEITKRIRKRPRTSRVPIVFVMPSGRADGDIAEAYAMGGVDCISKPFNPDLLRSKVGAFVEFYRAAQAVRRQNEFVRAVLDTIGNLGQLAGTRRSQQLAHPRIGGVDDRLGFRRV